MNEKETSKDIIAEMRTKAECAKPYDDGIVMMLTDYADRLEAAHKRERGDCAKLREALEICLRGMCGYCRMDAEARGMTTECVNGCEVMLGAKAALAAPPRNCDVGTAMEQGERFLAYCQAHKHPESECLPCPLLGQTGGYCELAWAQLPYKEGGAK